MAYDVRKPPAEYASARARREELRVSLFLVGLLVVLAVLLVATRHGHGLLLLAPVALAGYALKVAADRQMDRALRWMKGSASERAVGDELNTLVRDGFVVMHDIEQDGEGNVDHLVSGLTGAFLIETKHRSYDRNRDLRKARRQAAKLGDELEGWVTPVICLVQRGGRRAYQHDKVWIVPKSELVAWILRQRQKPIPFERLARFADRVDS